MSSQLFYVISFIYFVGRWLLFWVIEDPLLFLFLLSLPLLTLLTCRLLSSLSLPPALASGRTTLLLLLTITALLLHCSSLQARLAATHTALEDSHWSIRQGQSHRLSLLSQLSQREGEGESQKSSNESSNPLDGCLHVFIDLGTNRGLQIRKLYEPHVFPLAPILPLYQRYFGPPETRNLQEICSVGFEPNSAHTDHLESLAANYSTCGIRVVMFTETGVGNRDTTGSFVTDITFMDSYDIIHDMGARFIPEDLDQSLESMKETHSLGGTEVRPVKMVRFAKFLTEVVAARKLPLSAGVMAPQVVVKCDIEGGELQVVTDMAVTGALGLVDNLHMEWHGVNGPVKRHGEEPEMIDRLAMAVTTLGQLTKELGMEKQFTVEEVDDETYSGLVPYTPWGDYSALPSPRC